MVMKMNKTEFINKLSKELKYSKCKCVIINDILESNFFISKKNKDIIIKEFIQKLNVSNEEAKNIYEIAVKILNEEIEFELKHPFKSID